MFNLINGNRLIFLLSILGLIAAVFLAYEYLQTTPIVCPLTGSGCETVKNSAYSKFLGISIPYFGIAFYTFMAFISVMLSHKEFRSLKILQVLAIIPAFLFSVYLTYLEATVIKAYCFWCLTSAAIITIILITIVLNRKTDENRD